MNILFFRFYLIFVLILLLIFAFFISKELLAFLFNNIKLNYLLNELNKHDIKVINSLDIFHYYTCNGDIFLSILFCEFLLKFDICIVDPEIIYVSLAYAYKKKSFYSIAEYYYFKVLSLSGFREEALFDLNKMYNFLNYEIN